MLITFNHKSMLSGLGRDSTGINSLTGQEVSNPLAKDHGNPSFFNSDFSVCFVEVKVEFIWVYTR